jgi:hypothetical protein
MFLGRGMVVHACKPRDSGRGGRRIMVRGQPRQKPETISEEQRKSKRNEDLTEVVECLSNKFKSQIWCRKKKSISCVKIFSL